jgi:hypothetical protein
MTLQAYVKGTEIQIVGTAETVMRTCYITGFSQDGTIEDYAEDTVWWESSEQRKGANGQPLYVGDDGGEYTEDQLEFRDAEGNVVHPR